MEGNYIGDKMALIAIEAARRRAAFTGDDGKILCTCVEVEDDAEPRRGDLTQPRAAPWGETESHSDSEPCKGEIRSPHPIQPISPLQGLPFEMGLAP